MTPAEFDAYVTRLRRVIADTEAIMADPRMFPVAPQRGVSHTLPRSRRGWVARWLGGASGGGGGAVSG